MTFDVPAVVRRKARNAGAEHWLDVLPDLLQSLERDWLIRVGTPFEDATEAYGRVREGYAAP